MGAFAGPLSFTNTLSPIQAAVILECLSIIDDDEGDERRTRLMANAHLLRSRLRDAGFEVRGAPSAIVPVVLGGCAISRIITREVLQRGALVNLIEYPAVPRNGCRWRLHVMADHSPDEIEAFVKIAVDARARANEMTDVSRWTEDDEESADWEAEDAESNADADT